MTFVPPKINPDSFDWLEQQDLQTLQYPHLLACAVDYIRHNVEDGVPSEQFQDPHVFVQPGDLQELANVVSWWPQDPRCPVRKPTAGSLLTSIRNIDPSKPRQTFREALMSCQERAVTWLRANNHDPDNPNETAKERSNRMAAARMRKMRSTRALADFDPDDPEEVALIESVRMARENLRLCKEHIKTEERLAKAECETIISQAKLAKTNRIGAANSWLYPTQRTLLDAEQALDNYRIRK